jgi:hypothetical protein
VYGFICGNQVHFNVIGTVVKIEVFQKNNPVQGVELKLQKHAQKNPT